jgi:hypothetical protein
MLVVAVSGGNHQAGADGAAFDGERDEHSAPTGPQPRGRPRPAHRHRLSAAWAKWERAGLMAAGSSCDRGG